MLPRLDAAQGRVVPVLRRCDRVRVHLADGGGRRCVARQLRVLDGERLVVETNLADCVVALVNRELARRGGRAGRVRRRVAGVLHVGAVLGHGPAARG